MFLDSIISNYMIWPAFCNLFCCNMNYCETGLFYDWENCVAQRREHWDAWPNAFQILEIYSAHVWQLTLKKITHFEKKIQSALNLGPNQRTLNNFYLTLTTYQFTIWETFTSLQCGRHLPVYNLVDTYQFTVRETLTSL